MRRLTTARAPSGALFLAWLTACSTAGAPLPAAEGDSALRPLIGPAACRSDADCRTLAVGSKACGGPERYLAWSVLNTDAQALTAAAERHAASQGAQQAKSGRLSTCAMVIDPGASCVGEEVSGKAANGPLHCALRSGLR